MENNKRFQEKGLNVATNSRQPAGENVLRTLSQKRTALDADGISEDIGYPVSTVRKWLNILKREGLVVKHMVGKVAFFSLRGKNLDPDE